MPDENTHTQAPAVDGGTHTFGAPDGTGTFTPTPGGAGAHPAPTLLGYEVLESVGVGGMGRVYRARQLATNRVVAVKLILAGEFAGASARERFKAEIETTAKLSHPHIVQLYEAGEADGRAFLVCEFVPGGSLAARLDGTPWEAKRAARLLVPLAQAVAHAHAAGIVHRDLKPANILLAADGTPKVADFGIAKQMGSDSRTNTGAVLGTPSYMPPEQAGSAKAVGAAADVYSLGAILYELLTGRPPFKGADFVETIDLVRTQEPVPPHVLQPKVPRDAETICLKCLQKDPAKRYPTANALADDLGRFLEGRPIVARPVGVIERGWRWTKRNPALAGLMAAVVLVFTAGSVVAWYFAAKAEGQEAAAHQERLRARDARQLAEEEQAKAADERRNAEAARDQAEELLYAGRVYQANVAAVEYRTDRLTAMLDDTRPRAGQPDRRGWEWHYLHRLIRSWTEEYALDPIPAPDTKASDPNQLAPEWRFSSDLSRAIVQYPGASGTQALVAGLYDTATGKRLRELPELKNQLPTSSMAPPFSPALSPDLTFAAVTESYKKLLQLPAGVAGPPREVDRCRVRLLDLRVPKEREDVTPFPELEVVPTVYVADRGNRVLLYLTSDFGFGPLGAGSVLSDPKSYPRLEVWERGREGPVRTRLQGVTRSVFVAGVSPDGKTVVLDSIETPEGGKGAAPGLRCMDLWDVSGQPVRRARLSSAPAALSASAYATFSAGGQAVAVSEADYAFKVFDGRTGDALGRWVPPRDTMAPFLPSVQVSDDGRRLAFSGKNESIVVGERTGDGLVSTPEGNFRVPDRDPVGTWRATVLRPPWGANGLLPGSQLALSADGRRLLDGKGTTYRVWDLARTEYASSWPEFISLGGAPASAAPSARGHRLLYSALDFEGPNTLPARAFRFRLRDPQRTEPDRDFSADGKSISGAISADGQRLLLTEWNPTSASPIPSELSPTRWSLRAANDPARELRAGDGPMQFSRCGRWLLGRVQSTTGSLQSVRVYRASDGALASTISCSPEETVADPWMTPGGTLVLVAHAKLVETNGKVPDPIPLTLRFFDAATGAARGSWAPPTTWPLNGGPGLNGTTWELSVPDAFYSPDGRKLGLSRVGPDGAVRAWVLDATTGALEAEFAAPATGRQIAPTRRSGPPVPERAGGTFGPGERVSVWAGDSDLVTWANPGAPAVRLTGHESGTAVAFTANGRRAFTLDREYGFGRDLTVRVWNPSDGRELIAMRFRINEQNFFGINSSEMWLEGERLHVLTPTGVRVFDGTPLKD